MSRFIVLTTAVALLAATATAVAGGFSDRVAWSGLQDPLPDDFAGLSDATALEARFPSNYTMIKIHAGQKNAPNPPPHALAVELDRVSRQLAKAQAADTANARIFQGYAGVSASAVFGEVAEDLAEVTDVKLPKVPKAEAPKEPTKPEKEKTDSGDGRSSRRN